MAGESGYEYQGADILQYSDALRNYNRSIAVMARAHAGDAHDVLDFGAGIGTLAEAMRSFGLAPLCLEPDARQRAELERRGFRTVAGLDDVADASLGFIYSSNVLEHIEDDVATLVELRRKLRPDGRLFLYVPAFQSLYSAMDRAVGHYRRYERADITAKLRQAGYAVEDVYYADVLGYFVTRLFMRLGNDTGNINSVTLGIYDRAVFPVGQLIERIARVPVGKNVVAVGRNA